MLLLTHPLLPPPVPPASPAGSAALGKKQAFFHLCCSKSLFCFSRFSEGPGNHLRSNEIFVSGHGNAGHRTRARPCARMFRPLASRFTPAWFCATGWKSARALCVLGCRGCAPGAGCSTTGALLQGFIPLLPTLPLLRAFNYRGLISACLGKAHSPNLHSFCLNAINASILSINGNNRGNVGETEES